MTYLWFLAIFAGSAALCGISGCQRAVYHAAALPQELAALPAVDVQSLDLGQLASATSDSRRIHPGDALKVTVITGVEDRRPEAWPLRVADDGSVQVPLVGTIVLAGLDPQAAQERLRQVSVERGVFLTPSVSVAIDQRQTNHVTVIGAVEKPGDYELPLANSDLLSALSAAGGLRDDAEQIVEIRQPPLPGPSSGAFPHPPDPQHMAQPPHAHAPVSYQAAPPQLDVIRIDLVAATQAGPQGGVRLRDGSVVAVRRKPPRYIHVLGLVKRPDQFELPPDQNVRLLSALAMAGGRTLSMADRILVLRQVPGSPEPAVIQVSVREAKSNSQENLLLQDGDVVTVEETPATFVVGMLQQFIRFGVNGSVGLF